MSRQDKSTSERHTKTLRELVKRSENKVCADCKRNDPRWASWNLGVFLCIRCSGIHRGMGTHISKIKSVDLDIWTTEQMDSIQKWGNVRANLYWEAHLKPGHIPAEHKMESFIRSKYESRRWALEGPPPSDPSVLQNSNEHQPDAAPSPPPQQTSSFKSPSAASVQRQPHMHAKSPTSIQSQSRPVGTVTPSVSAPAPTPQEDLFNLDFHAPASTQPASPGGQKKDVKNDILSLFSSTPAPVAGAISGGGFGVMQPVISGPGTDNVWGQQKFAGQSPQSGIWSQQQRPQQQFGTFSAPTQLSQNLVLSQNAWGGSGASPAVDLLNSPFSTPKPSKKDDAFGDLWGGFK